MKNRITELFKIVLQQSRFAFESNEIPIGALIYNPKNFKIIAFDHNKELSLNDPLAHAEILVIRKSCNILGQKRLDGLSMLTSVAPCDLCLEAIKSSRLKEVHYIFPNENPKRNNLLKAKMIHHDIKTKNLMKTFFENKRSK